MNFLGCGAGYNTAMRNTNAFFMKGEKLYVIDCGETTFEILQSRDEIYECSEITIILTHLHGDHAGSLGSFASYAYYVLHKPVNIVHPIDTVKQLLYLMGIDENEYNYYPDIPEHLKNDVQLTPVEVKHVENMRCFGYIIKTGDWSVYFSGDAVLIPDNIIEMLENGKLDMIYHDTSSIEKQHPTHASLDYLAKVIKPEFRSKVFCMHLDCDFRDRITEVGFSYVTPLE